MFITFEFLIGSLTKEKIEVLISTPKEAAAFVFFLETTERVRAFKMGPYSPRDLGLAPNESFTKYRENGFTKEDYCDPYSPTVKAHKQQDTDKLEITQLRIQQVLNEFKALDIHKG